MPECLHRGWMLCANEICSFLLFAPEQLERNPFKRQVGESEMGEVFWVMKSELSYAGNEKSCL